jgi:hypothetical protein
MKSLEKSNKFICFKEKFCEGRAFCQRIRGTRIQSLMIDFLDILFQFDLNLYSSWQDNGLNWGIINKFEIVNCCKSVSYWENLVWHGNKHEKNSRNSNFAKQQKHLILSRGEIEFSRKIKFIEKLAFVWQDCFVDQHFILSFILKFSSMTCKVIQDGWKTVANTVLF